MSSYRYTNRPHSQTNADLLREQIAAGVPGFLDFDRDSAGGLNVRFSADLTAAQKITLDGIVAGHNASQLTAAQQAEKDAADAQAAAQNVDTPISDLAAARVALGNARLALQTSVPNLNSIDTTIQGLAAGSSASVILSNLKTLSQRNRVVIADIVSALQAQVDADKALADALVALKART